jgi:SAM-dependent methyltransferase
MFTASAELYDLIYGQLKDYRAEAAQLATLIRSRSPDARRILDVACGTGEHARLLVQEHGFEVDGLDLDPELVRIARSKLPQGSVYHADMISFALGRTYDVLVCLFSSIGYVLTMDNLGRTLACFRKHVADGGLVIVEPWFAPGVLESGRVYMKTAETPDVVVCRMSHTEVEDRISRLRFEYLIGRRSGIERASEVHELGLFTTDEMAACFAEAGLSTTYDPQGPGGRGLFTARAV